MEAAITAMASHGLMMNRMSPMTAPMMPYFMWGVMGTPSPGGTPGPAPS
jgi:hypothetical protein